MPTISASLLPRVQKTRGREAGRRGDLHPGRLLRLQGRKDRQQIRPQVHLLDAAGRTRVARPTSTATRPRGPTEASIDKAAADSAGLELGEKIELIGQGSARKFRLVGFTQLGSASFGGASIAQVTLPVAQGLTHKLGRFDQISVAAADGVSPAALKRRIKRRDAGRGAGRDRQGKRRPQLRRNPRQPQLPARPSCWSSASSPSSSAPS